MEPNIYFANIVDAVHSQPDGSHRYVRARVSVNVGTKKGKRFFRLDCQQIFIERFEFQVSEGTYTRSHRHLTRFRFISCVKWKCHLFISLIGCRRTLVRLSTANWYFCSINPAANPLMPTTRRIDVAKRMFQFIKREMSSCKACAAEAGYFPLACSLAPPHVNRISRAKKNVAIPLKYIIFQFRMHTNGRRARASDRD